MPLNEQIADALAAEICTKEDSGDYDFYIKLDRIDVREVDAVIDVTLDSNVTAEATRSEPEETRTTIEVEILSLVGWDSNGEQVDLDYADIEKLIQSKLN